MPTDLPAQSVPLTANNNVSPRIPFESSLSPSSYMNCDPEWCIGNTHSHILSPTSNQCSSTRVIEYNDIVPKMWFQTYRFRYISTASAFFQNTSLNLSQSNRILVFFQLSCCPASTVFSTQNPDLFCLMCFISSPSLLNVIQWVSIVLRIKRFSQISKISLAWSSLISLNPVHAGVCRSPLLWPLISSEFLTRSLEEWTVPSVITYTVPISKVCHARHSLRGSLPNITELHQLPVPLRIHPSFHIANDR